MRVRVRVRLRLRLRLRVRVRVRVSECGAKIRNANRMPKSDDRTESNLRRGRREGRWEEGTVSATS